MRCFSLSLRSDGGFVGVQRSLVKTARVLVCAVTQSEWADKGKCNVKEVLHTQCAVCASYHKAGRLAALCRVLPRRHRRPHAQTVQEYVCHIYYHSHAIPCCIGCGTLVYHPQVARTRPGSAPKHGGALMLKPSAGVLSRTCRLLKQAAGCTGNMQLQHNHSQHARSKCRTQPVLRPSAVHPPSLAPPSLQANVAWQHHARQTHSICTHESLSEDAAASEAPSPGKSSGRKSAQSSSSTSETRQRLRRELLKVRGIGRRYEASLREQGITTIHELQARILGLERDRAKDFLRVRQLAMHTQQVAHHIY